MVSRARNLTHEEDTPAHRGGARGCWGAQPPYISRKFMPKRLQIVLFRFSTTMFYLFGTCNTPLERCFQDLSNGILQAPKSKRHQLVKPKKIYSRLATTEQVGQKNCNGKTTMFFTSALKESWACTYYWQRSLVRIGWSILWSSITKRSLPKLWILMTLSKTLWGCQLNESKYPNK